MKNILLILSGLLVVAGCIKEEQRGSDLKVGDMIPDFEVVMNDGRVVTDDDLKESASVVIFFHTSCREYMMNMPQKAFRLSL